MSKLSPARKLALDVLMEADLRGMYARDVLSSRASAKAIDQRDSAFAARLALGVAATQGILDELFDQFLDKPKGRAARSAWRFASRPSRCSTCTRRAALP
ncbi:MAG: transcription antitermination factor NusB [Collinsella sp.]